MRIAGQVCPEDGARGCVTAPLLFFQTGEGGETVELQDFGDHVRQMRKDMHMTQEKLAEKLDVTAQEISRYEKGHREMGGMMYAKLLKLHHEIMTKKDNELFEKIQKLSPEKRDAVLRMITALTE